MVNCKIWIGQNPMLWKKVQQYFFDNNIFWSSSITSNFISQFKTRNFIKCNNNILYYGEDGDTTKFGFNKCQYEELSVEETNINDNINYNVW